MVFCPCGKFKWSAKLFGNQTPVWGFKDDSFQSKFISLKQGDVLFCFPSKEYQFKNLIVYFIATIKRRIYDDNEIISFYPLFEQFENENIGYEGAYERSKKEFKFFFELEEVICLLNPPKTKDELLFEGGLGAPKLDKKTGLQIRTKSGKFMNSYSPIRPTEAKIPEPLLEYYEILKKSQLPSLSEIYEKMGYSMLI